MDASRTVSLLRRVRHDYGNHLQVISGYTELGRPNEVKEYIIKIIQQMDQEKKLFELESPELTLFLYEQMLLVNDLGIILRYKELVITSGPRLMASFKPYKIIKSLVEENNITEETTMEISIYELPEQIKIKIDCPMLSNSPYTFYIKE